MHRISIEEALKKHNGKLMRIPGVVGTGQGVCNGKPCIKVFVTKHTEELEKNIAKTIEGFPVIIEESGMFTPLS